MFSTSRRPVPSTAALRILRQLAYISSGTVCGAAALVAEERRRRTSVAKKIVENSRRLKQHPRYAHSATARKLDLSFFGPEGDDSKEREAAGLHGDVDLWDSDIEAHRTRPEPDAFRSNELPSEVEKSYRKFSRKRSSPTPKEGSQTQEGHRHDTGSEVHVRHPKDAYHGPLPQRTPIYERNRPSRDALHSAPAYAKPQPTDNNTLAPDQHDDGVVASMLDLDLPSLSVQVLEEQTLAFSTRLRREKAPEVSILATRLLAAAAQAGSLASLSHVVSWLLRRNELDADHLMMICVAAPAVFSHNDSEAARQFYVDLLSKKKLYSMTNLRLCKLLITASILDATQPQHPETMRVPLLQTVKPVSLTSSQVTEYVLECCRKLSSLNRLASITPLLRICAHQLHLFESASSDVAAELFDLSLQSQDLHGTVKLFVYLDQKNTSFGMILQRLVFRCRDMGEEALLLRLHRTHSRTHTFPEDVLLDLCSAYAKVDGKEAARLIMRHAKTPTSEASLAASVPAWPALIERLWSDTRNLKHTKRVFRSMQQLAGKGNTDVLLYNAIILACIKAGKPEQAEELLRQMQNQDGLSPNMTTFGHFILSAARARDWQVVQKLLGMLDSLGTSDAPLQERTGVFNPVLREFVNQHNPAEIWAFVTSAVDAKRVVPDRITNDIVLESFVHGQRLDLVQPWCAYMQTCGSPVRVRPYTAMRMIRRYYYDTRPSHINMMWLCRNITTSAPQLLSHDLMLLVRESIGYDVRNLGGQNAPRLFEAARARLDLLERAHDHIPNPSAWSTKLLQALHSSRSANMHEDVEFADIDNAVSTADIDDVVSTEPLGMTELDGQHISDERQSESDILIALSLGQPSEAVEFYKRSLAASGLPHSSVSLETAIMASLRAQCGNPADAEELLQSAQEAGLSTAASLMPLFMQRIASIKDGGQAMDPKKLTETVISFYHSMEKSGIPVRHHIATVAAHALYKTGGAKHAITLLRGVHASKWSQSSGRSLDVVAMTVLLQSYIRTRHTAGIDWTINTVLQSKMRIDTPFMRVLKAGKRHFRFAFEATGEQHFQDLIPSIDQWIRTCEDRQAEQISKATKFGRKLVNTILSCVQREELEADIIGQEWNATYHNASSRHVGITKNGVNLDKQSIAPAPRFSEGERSKADRAHLRRGLQEDERRLKFRYIDSTPA